MIDLYGSREWVEKGADISVLNAIAEEQYETSDFPLSELDLQPATLGALGAAGYDTFLQIIDLERRDFLGIEGLGEKDTDRILELIEALTVVEGDAGDGGGEGTQSEDSGELEENPNALIDEVGEQASDSEESDD